MIQANSESRVGYLSSRVTFQTGGIGSWDCPWVIKADAGQQINITLLDFNLNEENVTRQYGVVQELGEQKATILSRHPDHRESHVYLSTHNDIQIKMERLSDTYFLLKYEGITKQATVSTYKVDSSNNSL